MTLTIELFHLNPFDHVRKLLKFIVTRLVEGSHLRLNFLLGVTQINSLTTHLLSRFRNEVFHLLIILPSKRLTLTKQITLPTCPTGRCIS